jgi:hypothetical protein
MGESGDSIFVYPILDGYKKYKYSSIGYYFIWTLCRLDYPNLGKKLNELLENYEIQKNHIPMTLFFIAERNFTSAMATRMAVMYLDSCTDPEFRKDFDLNGIGLSCVLDYLQKKELLSRHENKLRELLFCGSTSRVERAVVLRYIFDLDQQKQIDYFIKNYFQMIQNTDLEKDIAKELILCKADNAKAMKKLILENGGSEAKRLLEKMGKKIGTFRVDAPENVVYSNMDAIIKIGILRKQINDKTSASGNFGFQVFPESELLVGQVYSIDDQDIFFNLCRNLLEIIRTVNPAVRNHGFDREEAREIWVDMEEGKENELLSQLILFLSSRKVGVDYNFYGFKQLDRALELMVEPKEDKEFYDELRRLGIEQLYREKKWHNIHSFFLNYYLQVLDNMNKELHHICGRPESFSSNIQNNDQS